MFHFKFGDKMFALNIMFHDNYMKSLDQKKNGLECSVRNNGYHYQNKEKIALSISEKSKTPPF